MQERQTVGFVGAGTMGGAMALRLLDAGYRVRVHDRVPARANQAVAHGAVAVPDPGAVASDVVIMMLPDSRVTRRVLFEAGLADAMAGGSTIVDMSSGDPGLVREHANWLATRGVGQLDAPVSQGQAEARAGTLRIMVGGDEKEFDRRRSVLSCLGDPYYLGPSGSGQVAKLVNQLILAVTVGAVAEGLLFGAAAGVEARQLVAALQGGYADGPVLRDHGRRMSQRDFERVGGPSHLFLKDLEGVRSELNRLGLRLGLVETVLPMFTALAEGRGGLLDHQASLVRQVERMNPGFQVGSTSHDEVATS
ncbi:MAG: NAD-binding protein [Micromonosporaceae bacterium]|nr:NAD-binding protein [Micromonosporaceae bacterium]